VDLKICLEPKEIELIVNEENKKSSMEKILILDNYDSFTYNLVHYVEANSGFEVDVFRNDEIALAEIDHYNTIILSPGPGLPKDAGILMDVIKEYGKHKKILGVCLGMQAIGEVFGASLVNLNKVFHGVSSSVEVLDKNDLLYQKLPKRFNIGRYHSWILSKENFPENLKVTSIEENGQIMSIKHRDFKIYGVQFHPESILTEHGEKIILNFLEI